MDTQAMTGLYRTEFDQILPAIGVGAWFVAGVLVGAFHLLTLRWNVRMFAAAQSLLLPLGIQLIRFALIAAVLAAITRSFGDLPLLVATVGISAMRMAIVRLEARP
jgi:F1F0 ATPase subunit 2